MNIENIDHLLNRKVWFSALVYNQTKKRSEYETGTGTLMRIYRSGKILIRNSGGDYLFERCATVIK